MDEKAEIKNKIISILKKAKEFYPKVGRDHLNICGTIILDLFAEYKYNFGDETDKETQQKITTLATIVGRLVMRVVLDVIHPHEAANEMLSVADDLRSTLVIVKAPIGDTK